MDVQNYGRKIVRRRLNAKFSSCEIKRRRVEFKDAAIKSPNCVRVKVKVQRVNAKPSAIQNFDYDQGIPHEKVPRSAIVIIRGRGV